MATNKSIEKIMKFLEKQKNPVTKTQIVEACALPSASVTECLNLLEKFGQVELISNEKTTLVRKKEGKNEN